MSTLPPQNPLSLQHRQCDERRRYIAGLEALAERLRTDEQRVRAEIHGAFADWLAPEAADGKPVCAQALIKRHGKLARVLAAVEGRIAAVSKALAAKARELKRHELAALPRADNAGLSGQAAAPPSVGPDHGG